MLHNCCEVGLSLRNAGLCNIGTRDVDPAVEASMQVLGRFTLEVKKWKCERIATEVACCSHFTVLGLNSD